MHYFIGWDVGGWNCTTRSKSRDAFAVLTLQEKDLQVVGKLFRGPIREEINKCNKIQDIVNEVCQTSICDADEITLAIDTPLGLPLAVQSLVTGSALPSEITDDYTQNPYLYRVTERWLFTRDFPTLSAIKDMIGSQATKGMHLLRKLEMQVADNECGVWRNGLTTVIESYPASCKSSDKVGYSCEGSAIVRGLFQKLSKPKGLDEDQKDAIYCALIAYLFATYKNQLHPPTDNPPCSEGWIWIPRDALGRKSKYQ